MSEPNAAPVSNAPKSRRFPVSLSHAIPAGLVVVIGVGFAAAFHLGVFEPVLDEVAERPIESADRPEGGEGKKGLAEEFGHVPADRAPRLGMLMGPSGADRQELEDSLAAPADRRQLPSAVKNRSAPKAIDLDAKDLVKSSGLLGSMGAAGGDIKGALGNLYGPRADAAPGFGGLGLRGSGSGGGGLGGTLGLGGIGTKGRGSGLSGYGTGAAAYRAASREPPAQALKAGATDDNAEFDKFVQFLSNWSDRFDTGGADLVDVRDRRFVKVTDAKGLPIPTASLRIVGQRDQTATTGTTYGDGRLAFYPRALRKPGVSASYTVEASFGGQKASAPWDGRQDLTLTFDADRAIQGAIQLDVLFALDTTGSMSDEIDRIKETLLSVTERLRGLPQKFDLRYGAVLFRDLGDDYLTEPLPFTGDVQAFMQSLQRVEAGGGGDEPESVNRALAEAVAAKWRPGAAKVVFLIGDAPPHMDYDGDVRYGETMKAALAKGIRIHSVAASGLSALGTLVWRQVAQYTRGKFVFIEYGSAQATAAAHGVKGNFESNNLDDILFEQLRAELEGWGKAEPKLQAARPEPATEKYAGPIQLHPRGR